MGHCHYTARHRFCDRLGLQLGRQQQLMLSSSAQTGASLSALGQVRIPLPAKGSAAVASAPLGMLLPIPMLCALLVPRLPPLPPAAPFWHPAEVRQRPPTPALLVLSQGHPLALTWLKCEMFPFWGWCEHRDPPWGPQARLGVEATADSSWQ